MAFFPTIAGLIKAAQHAHQHVSWSFCVSMCDCDVILI